MLNGIFVAIVLLSILLAAHTGQMQQLTEAIVMGTPVRALCGKIWVPSRDPEKYPVCPTCKEIWQRLPRGRD